MKTYIQHGIRIIYNTENSTRFNMHKTHFHDEYEIYYLVSGSRQLYINDRVFPLTSGSLAFVDGEDMHRTFSANEEPISRFVICMRKSKLQKEYPDLTTLFEQGGAIDLNISQQKEMGRLLYMLKDECEKNDFMQHEAISALVLKLFINAFRLRKEASSVVNDCNSLAVNIIDYINSHYSEKLTLEDISSHCHISISHLTRLFKASTGYSIVEYTNTLRVKKAAELLKSTDLSISEIALKTGFSSFSYFGKLFAECYGVSPLKYRKAD